MRNIPSLSDLINPMHKKKTPTMLHSVRDYYPSKTIKMAVESESKKK